jgi:ADP-heptose:LPS heptosyltransferase
VADDWKGLELFVDPAAGLKVKARLEEAGIGVETRLVALAPGAGRATKRWDAERFAAVGRHFAEKGYRIVILGGPKDRDVCSEVQARLERDGTAGLRPGPKVAAISSRGPAAQNLRSLDLRSRNLRFFSAELCL